MKYIGMHSTTIEPELDSRYMGSGKALPSMAKREKAVKEILKIFTTRSQARKYEIKLIKEFRCVDSPEYYNIRTSTHDKYNSSLSKEHRKQISKRHRGVPRPYLRKYKGKNRTPAQKAADERLRQTTKGIPNLKKGHPGTSNHAFIPWYYITPQGEYVEVFDMTKADLAKKLKISSTTLAQYFRPENQHKLITNGRVFKGYTFGNLPKP